MYNGVTQEMARKAISDTLVFARLECANHQDEAQGVVFAVWADGWSEPLICAMEELGPIETLVERFGWDFKQIAIDKLNLSREFGLPSDVIITKRPWLLRRGHTIFGGSYCEDNKLVVATSGSKERTDLAISEETFRNLAELISIEIEEARTEPNRTRL